MAQDRTPQQQSDNTSRPAPDQQNRQAGDERVPTRPAEHTGVGRDRAKPGIAQGIDPGGIRPGVSSDGDAQDI